MRFYETKLYTPVIKIIVVLKTHFCTKNIFLKVLTEVEMFRAEHQRCNSNCQICKISIESN